MANCCVLAVLILTIYMQKQLPDRYSVVAGEEITFASAYPIRMVQREETQPSDLAGSSYQMDLKLLGTIPVKTVEVNVVDRKMVTVSGAPFGIKMFTDGLMVVGMSDIPTTGGRVNPAKAAGLEIGDVIKTFNGQKLATNEQLAELILLAANVWLNPMIFDSTVEESCRKFMVFHQMLQGFGLDIMDQEMLDRLKELTEIYQKNK